MGTIYTSYLLYSKQHQTMIKMIEVLFIICFVPSAWFDEGIEIEIVNLDNQSASLKCSRTVSGNSNVTLSWLVDGAPAPAYIGATWFVDGAPPPDDTVTSDISTT